jgi:hypothetical protein
MTDRVDSVKVIVFASTTVTNMKMWLSAYARPHLVEDA